MKIALAHKRLDLNGGTERDFWLTAEGLRDLGHEVHLFCAEFGVTPPERVQAHRVPCLPLGRTARLLSFAVLAPKVILPYNCDVVVSFGRMARQDILRSGGGSHRVFLQKMAQGEGALRRVWHRVSLYHLSLLALEARQFRPAGYKKVLAVSQEVKREIMQTYGVPAEKIAVLYNGVDTERFHPKNRREWREKIKRQWSIPSDARLALFVGNGFRRKGFERLLAAWNSRRLQDVFLLVVGQDAQMIRYRSRAEKEAGGKIVFAGLQGDIEKYYAAADLLTLPAFQEAFGNVVLEALASGVPVLVSKEVGAAEVLTGDLAEGILTAPDDPAEIETKIHRLLSAERWPSLSEQARRLGETYSWKNHFRNFERQLYEIGPRRQ
jgi:UDP-glucose:(heptosyl)LPS alpha-1,3-glucosyltransferase